MKKHLYRLLLVVLALVFLFSGWKLLTYFHESKENRDRYSQLADIVEQARPETTCPPAVTESESPVPSSAPSEIPTETESGILPEYAALLERNPHTVGWIAIEDTVINYPVVQTPDRPEYYLYRDFDGEYNDWGCLFADAACHVETGDNVIIYGHHMNDGSMFASLTDYEKKSYWEDHPEIRFDTLTEQRTYRVFSVIRTTATVGEGFPYHRFTDAETESDFDLFVADCKALSLYDTGIIPEYGDKLLCLSTCEYTRENGRFVVIGVYRPE